MNLFAAGEDLNENEKNKGYDIIRASHCNSPHINDTGRPLKQFIGSSYPY